MNIVHMEYPIVSNNAGVYTSGIFAKNQCLFRRGRRTRKRKKKRRKKNADTKDEKCLEYNVDNRTEFKLYINEPF